MKKYGLIIVLLLLIAVLIYWFSFRKKESPKELSDEDRLALIEDSALSNNSQPHDSIVFPNTPLGNQLSNHMMILAMPAETIEEADAKYNASLAELKKKPEEAVSLLNEAYKKTEARHYFNRWGIVKTLGDIESTLATGPLADIALSRIPPETSKDLHHFSSQEEEIIIRIRAIEGLGKLAKTGDKNADGVLLRLALDSTNKNSAIQLRAIKAYLRAGKNADDRIKYLKSRLDKSLHDIITVSITTPEEFMGKMETIKKVSDDSTKKDKAERPSSATSPPKIKTN